MVGAFTFVLHSHIPYCRKHGAWPFGEEWLFEAICETYIPLLDAINELAKEGYSSKLTIGLTPVLTEQLNDSYMKRMFWRYILQKIDICTKDIERFQSKPEFLGLATFYKNFYLDTFHSFRDKYNTDLVGAFKKLQDDRHIEIITSCATHGYLPLLGRDSAIRAQIKIGTDSYSRKFGKKPRGIWLPEMAYRPRGMWRSPVNNENIHREGVETYLAEENIDYFFVDNHTIEGGKGKGVYNIKFPLKTIPVRISIGADTQDASTKTTYCPYLLDAGMGKHVAIFGRNERTGLQVWSGEWGYPGDSWYREFHKRDSVSGLQYWRVTDKNKDLGTKQIYVPNMTDGRVEENASHFVSMVYDMLKKNKDKATQPIVVAPYDTELFGHWWFEGIRWLKAVIKKLYLANIESTTCSEYLDRYPPNKVIKISESSWGNGSLHQMWLNDDTKWIWNYIYIAEQQMETLAENYIQPSPSKKRLLNQAARELLSLESSDWPFMTSTRQAYEYASQRVIDHYTNFDEICDAIVLGKQIKIEDYEDKNNMFSDIDYRVFAGRSAEKKMDFSKQIRAVKRRQ